MMSADISMTPGLTPAGQQSHIRQQPAAGNVDGSSIDARLGIKNASNLAGAATVPAAMQPTPVAPGTPGGDAAEQDDEQLTQLTDSLTQMMSLMRKGLEFRLDESEGEPVVSVMDMDSGELIRQIPTEEALALAEKISDITGVLMKTQA